MFSQFNKVQFFSQLQPMLTDRDEYPNRVRTLDRALTALQIIRLILHWMAI